MKQPTHHSLTARVSSVRSGSERSLVTFDVVDPAPVASMLSTQSVEHLGLKPGDEVHLIVKTVHVLPVEHS